MSLSEGKVRHMKALSNKQGVIAAAAMDQRGSLKKVHRVAPRAFPPDQVTDEMMSEFKVAVSKVLTPHASAILLDPEYGLPAAKARSSNAGLLLAYEESGYDNTKPGRLPDLLPHVSAKRIADWGAERRQDSDLLLAFRRRSGQRHQARVHRAHRRGVRGRCRSRFSCEFVGYDPKGGDEKGLEFAKLKPQVVIGSMEEFSKPQYKIDVLKVEVPINANYVEGSSVYKGQKAYSRSEALEHFASGRRRRQEAVHLSERGCRAMRSSSKS